MLKNWRLIGLHAVLVAALTASPAVAGADTDTPKSKELVEIEKRLDRIVSALERLEGLKKDIQDIREDMRFQREVKNPSVDQEIRDLQQQVLRLTEDVARLRTPAGGRTSYYGGPGPGPGPGAATSTIRVRNAHVVPVTVAINERPYEVPPGSELVLNNQPAGEFTYEVVGIQPPVRRMLAASKPFSIEVFPR
jgi:hypothetical protein